MIAILVLSGVMVAAVLVARRNLRLDRADRKGATKLAIGGDVPHRRCHRCSMSIMCLRSGS